MSDAAGTDNPAFASEDECGTKTENGGQQQQVTSDQDRKSSSADCAPVENGQRSFISQHYVEPVKASSEPCYKTETRIELPAENTEKSAPEPKLNGVHGNGNNNDASFLNNSTTSVQVNESGKKEQIEAVNLELVSMRPYTGNNIQTKGQEACEVPADPYEEYFVPVNEHRKYIRDPEAEVETTVAGVRFDLGPGVGREGLSLRDPAAGLVDYSHWLTALRGEKLYVTKDKRSRNSYWKQLMCGLIILVVAIAAIIIILAATGVLFTQETTEPLENVKDNTRQFDINIAENQEYVKNPPSSPPPLTSTFPSWPTTDETLYQIIPDALNGILRLDDVNWNDDLSDTKSRVYRQITAEIEEHLGNILQRENSTPIIKVYNINNEGEIKFRISHPPMNTPEKNQEYIEEALRKNSNMIGQYHLSRLQVEKLIDQCEHGNLQCAESCKYDYSMGIFICTCSSEKMLDQDGKTCVDNDLSNVEMDDLMPQSSTESVHDFVQGRSRDPNTAQFEIRHSNTWGNPDLKTESAETDTSTSKPRMEHDHSQLEQKPVMIHQFESTPTTKRIFENDNFYWNHEHSHHSMETTFEEPAVEPEPTAEPETTAEPELAAEAEPTVAFHVPPESTQSELNVESESTSEPVSEFSAKPKIVYKIESITEIEPATESVSVTESATTTDEADDDIMSKTESHLESNTEISNQQESIIKSTSHDDAESTQISLLDDANTTNVPKSLADSIRENNENSEIDKSLITTIKTNLIDDNVSLQVIPLKSENKSIDTNDNVEIKMESTTMPSYTNKDDKINESTTIEASFTTVNYVDLKQNGDDNVVSNKSRNHEKSNTEQFTQSPGLQEEKENDSTTEINLDVNLSNDSIISKEFNSIIVTTTMSTISVENGTELITRSTLNDKHSHTIEINGISNKNQETYNNPKAHETTMIPETTSTDMSTQPISDYQKEHAPESALQSDTQDSNEKNVIEHMPTTVFPKVPKNFAHNVEPLKEPITKPADDEHIMLISKSEQPVEIHAIIPQLTPEQSIKSTQNESLKAENSTEINNGVVINEDLNAKKSVKDIFSIDSSTVRNDKNIVHTDSNGYTIHPDEVQHSTHHPLHPAILPENSVNHFAGKSDISDDRHIEDMSPFLPDIHKEKENAKKAPRLDKDEQDVPNPFETHIDDVITHRPLIHVNADDIKQKVNETEIKDLLNDVNLHSVSNERNIDITEKTTKNYEINDAKNIIKNDLNISEIMNDTESKIHNILHQDDSFAKSNNITKDAVNKKNSNSSVMEEDDNEALKVIPLAIEDKLVDSIFQTTMQSTDKKTLESTKVTTGITAGKKVEDLGDSVIESGTTSLEKPEENAVEDQYNDITDESLSKGYRHDNVGKDIPIKVAEGSKKVILNDIDPIKISYNHVPSSTIASDIVKEKNETNVDATQSSLNTKIKGVLEKQMEDVRLTTQEPVLPMEIQQEMSTTMATDKIEITTVIDNDKREENNMEQPNIDHQSNEREADKIAQITTIQSTLETKTTAQVPILPEELQTTENDMLMTTSMTPSEEKEMNQEAIDKTKQISTENIKEEMKKNVTDLASEMDIDINSTSSERSMTASMYENNVNIGAALGMEHDENINDPNRTIENSTESAKIETTLMMSATEKSAINSTERTSFNDVTTTEDIRPVTEMLDDTQPRTEFDHRMLFITTPRPISIEPELSEEALRVIPLEKSQESKKKSSDKKGFDKYKYKKEKDLSLEEQNENNALTEKSSSTILSQTEPSKIITRNYEEPNDSVVSSDLDPSIPRFTLFNREDNILPKLLKITGNTDESSVENKGAIAEIKPKNYPSFIPVSEEIIEPVPVTESYIVMRNTRPTFVSSSFETEENTAVNETAIEGRTSDPETDLSRIHVRANETTEQPVAFFSDQSFGDAEEIDRVTKELSTIRLTVRTTTPLDMSVESATTVASISFSGSTPDAFLSKCITGQFQCANGTSRDGAYCIPLSDKCDSKNDCSDGSDELDCEDCSGNFRCASGQCLKRHFVCDKIVDCDDGSDERDCENWKCQSDEFRCSSGRCIPASWQCNGRLDCEEHRDEYNCSESCKDNQYLCPTEKWCIPQTWRCNGIAECINEEDEKLCDCGPDQFKCQTGGCVSSIQICDGIKNCPDYSDEWGCLITNITADRTNTETNINTENNMASESSDHVPLLKIRQYDNDYRLVCSDGWIEEFSDSYCQTLGFAGAETTKFMPLSAERNRSEKILRLKTNPNRLPLVTNLEQVEFCVSNKAVQVSCEEFSCGLHYAEGPTARLAGGTSASDGKWSSVALLKELKHGTACTASILGPMHALASYSCIYRYKDSNGWQFFAGGDMLKGQSVKNIVPYPQVKYNQFLYNNDIALIELEEPLVFSRNISAVCLPRQSIQLGQICVTAGWGFSMNGEIDLQQYLKFLPLPTYDSDKCNVTSHYAGFITEHNICAEFTDTDKDPCYNDEGAPLMCASESQGISERWEIQGLLSYHSRCSRGHPAIYSSLEPALSWLRESVPALQTQS